MKIISYKMICPKCKKEYVNNFLASFSDRFKSAAKSFLNSNTPSTHCEDCHIELIHENLIKYFDDMGNYSPKSKKINKGFDLFCLYLEVLQTISNFFSCVNNGKIVLTGNIKKEGTNIYTNLTVIGKYNNKEYELLSATIDEYSLEIGDRKNKFIEYNLIGIANSIILNIYNYIFIDDCNSYSNKDKSIIKNELINI